MKRPAFLFYVGDWLRDSELQTASAPTRGIWINALAHMWGSRDRGKLTGSKTTLARLLNCTIKEMSRFLEEAEALEFCEISQDPNGILTVINRRMYREEKERALGRKRARRHYNKKRQSQGSNADSTENSRSHSSSSFASSNNIKEFIPLSLRFHLQQKESGLQHKEFKDHLTEESPIVVSGAETLERIKRLDNESLTDIEDVLDFVLEDVDFWKNQVVSLASLRGKSKNGNTKYFNIKNAMGKNHHDKPQFQMIQEGQATGEYIAYCSECGKSYFFKTLKDIRFNPESPCHSTKLVSERPVRV